MNQQAVASLSHIGICVSNAERSMQFYTEALGFVHERSIDEIGAPFDALTELPGVTFSAHYLKSGGVTIELIGFPAEHVTGQAARRPMNQLGFTHMTLIVGDLEQAMKRVVEFGGKIISETKIDSPYGPIVFCTDPDGVRVELMQVAS